MLNLTPLDILLLFLMFYVLFVIYNNRKVGQIIIL